MSLSYEKPDPSKKATGKPVRWRLMAILIMVVGAAGFFIGLLWFEQQIGCLALSTLITIAGLALNITARRKGWMEQKDGGGFLETRQAKASQWLARSRAPKGLRKAAHGLSPVQQPMAVPAPPVRRTVSLEEMPSSLVDRVIAILEAQGAVVTVESERESRGILRIITGQGQRYVAMVIAAAEPVDVPVVRSLLALIQGSGSLRGYLIAGAGFTQAAYDWAEGRSSIRLVGEDELDELGV